MDGGSPLIENLRQLFSECDTDQNGSLAMDEFGQLCQKIGLNMEAAAETFERLDIDKNGKITFDEFAAGFMQTCKHQQPAQRPPSQPSVSGGGGGVGGVGGVGGSTSGAPSPTTGQHHQAASSRLASPSPVASRARKSASPLGVMSLGSTGSSSSCSNLASTSSCSTTGTSSLRSTASHHQMFASGSGDLSGPSSGSGPLGAAGESQPQQQQPSGAVVVYSSDLIEGNQGCDYDQASGSGQFGSLLSNGTGAYGGGNYNQVKTMQDLLDCVQKLQNENQILSQIFFKDKREREEYISQLGEEFDQQLKEVEERANRRAREELESEKRRLREMMQTERETLQHHYQTLEKISKLVKAPNGGKADGAESIDKVRSKLEDTFMENRQLKKSLLDTKSDVALIWKEMEKLKRQYEDKLSSAYERHNETRNECDHIKQQLSLMKDSNRRLQDASDVIANYITDKVEPVIKVATTPNGEPSADGGRSRNILNHFNETNANLGPLVGRDSRRGSILSEYLSHNQSDDESPGLVTPNEVSLPADLESLASSQGAGRASKKPNKPAEAIREQCKMVAGTSESLANELEVANERESEPPPTTDTTAQSSAANKGDNQAWTTKTQQQSLAQDTTGASLRTPPSASSSSGLKSFGRHFLLGSSKNSSSLVSQSSLSSISNNKLKDSNYPSPTNASKTFNESNEARSISGQNQVGELIVEQADGPSRATFNIILVGDSFVGKSSFAARFMEGSFVQGLISNCSIDFKTKAYKVDGVNYTINLWDTAGQERFRSITASYFRKADGIILMYDVTDKRSYLNVRNWMSTISDTAAENVAVLLVGNKIDLRHKDNNHHKCVPTDEGHRLAREYDIVFLETSVKTGTNLLPSMGQLIRLIAKNNLEQNKEVDKDRIKLNDKGRAFNCMPKNC